MISALQTQINALTGQLAALTAQLNALTLAQQANTPAFTTDGNYYITSQTATNVTSLTIDRDARTVTCLDGSGGVLSTIADPNHGSASNLLITSGRNAYGTAVGINNVDNTALNDQPQLVRDNVSIGGLPKILKTAKDVYRVDLPTSIDNNNIISAFAYDMALDHEVVIRFVHT